MRTTGDQRITLRAILLIASAALITLISRSALAADLGGGWSRFWLPPVRSKHGSTIDALVWLIFWITLVVLVAVHVALAVLLIRYRARGKTARTEPPPNSAGNLRVEIIWTAIPLVVLLWLAFHSKAVWEDFRDVQIRRDIAADVAPAKVLVVGEQFKWNIVYPGPDGKIGRYLKYPRPTDERWPSPRHDGKPYAFAGVAGPAALPYDQACEAIERYVAIENPLGKDFDDPDGFDDDWVKQPGRTMYLPTRRPIEVELRSKDVIHDFFVPNFRLKLDAVPGLRGTLRFTLTTTSKQREDDTLRNATLAEVEKELADNPTKEIQIRIDEQTVDPAANRDKIGWRYVDLDDPKRPSIVRDGTTFPPGSAARRTIIDKLRAAGITQLRVCEPGYWELECAELCGQGHFLMTNKIVVIEPEEYRERFETRAK